MAAIFSMVKCNLNNLDGGLENIIYAKLFSNQSANSFDRKFFKLLLLVAMATELCME